ncbi:hypothetical protein OWV82_013542 [Melia azedarach]|uniref:Uncharacterized protein n=1 Tax=Melia azedarach TaxID=155640 RepID=A0ACC1XWS0_MELAZ|nr:hypothetical protein OWV82_013542 [Melia azedarach]
MLSPAERVSGSCPNLEWWRKMSDCIKEMRKLLDCVEHCDIAQTERMSNSPGCLRQNNNNDAAVENDELSEIVVVEKKGDALIIDVKCPCGAVYKILLMG